MRGAPASGATTDLVDISDPGLQGRSAIVTGATSGNGLSLATALAQAGVHVTFDYVARYAVPYQTDPCARSGIEGLTIVTNDKLPRRHHVDCPW